jgi:hypothetical protein
LDLALIERLYIGNRKDFKRLALEEAHNRNVLLEEIIGRERLTRNQRQAAKRWLLNHLPELERERLLIIRSAQPKAGGKQSFASPEKMFEKVSEAKERFKKRAREALLSQFKVRERAVVVGERPARKAIVKAGTRAERIAAYKPSEKTVSQKRKEMQQEESKANVTGEVFDQVKHALDRIRAENGASAKVITELRAKGLLTGDSVIRMFIAGSLTQKVFQKVVQNKAFQRNFGNKGFDLLARGLSFIGPTGKFTAKARKSFQGEAGKRMFDFLKRHDFIDTSHGKGEVITYLARI